MLLHTGLLETSNQVIWVGFGFGFFVRTSDCRSLAIAESSSILQAKRVLCKKEYKQESASSSFEVVSLGSGKYWISWFILGGNDQMTVGMG